MPKNLRWKWIVIVAIVAACVAGITGITGPSHNIRLGLDLKGGSHMVLQVQIQDAFKVAADQAIEQLKEALAKNQIAYAALDRNDPSSLQAAGSIAIELHGVAPGHQPKLAGLVKETVGDTWQLTPSGPTDFRLTARKEAALALRQETITQTIETLNRKVNGLGVAEASVQQRGGADGEAEVLVQLPGIDDPARVKTILQTAALLELTEVKGGPYPSQPEALAANNGVLPLNTKLVRGSLRAAGQQSWWLLARSPVVTGRDLRDARPQQNESGSWDTTFVLNQDAAKRFERYTEANVGNHLAIVLDAEVLSAPRIDSKISDQGRITGAGNQQEAADLALNLRAGSLPAGIKVIEERIVGPSLGADSVRQGLTSGLVGLVLVIASMIAYYRGAGWNAVFAMLLNTIITVAALSYIDATWTLPGIAGLVLSIGMAVDSNVLIFERIKEELAAQRGVRAAINAGFGRVFLTLLDTHISALIAALFLIQFGTGPIRGFAYTLIIGLVSNLFTSTFVSKTLFELELGRRQQVATLSI